MYFLQSKFNTEQFPRQPKLLFDLISFLIVYIEYSQKNLKGNKKMKATKIKMKIGCAQSNNTTEISEIYVEGCTNPGYFAKESLYNYLKITLIPFR